MSHINIDALGVPLIEMRCPECGDTQYYKPRTAEPVLTQCLSCKRYLFLELLIKEKPNHILLKLRLTPVPQVSDIKGALNNESLSRN